MARKKLYYLLCGLLTIVAMILIINPPSIAQTAKLEVNLITGSESGEYYSISQDIEKLAVEKNSRIDIDVIPSRGALQNIHDVFYYDSIPLGITQGDVLAFLNTFANSDEEKRVQAESLRSVLPLYQEEIHLITRSEIKSISELADKKISIGDEGSGTSTTASTLLYQWGIKPEELLTYDIKKAISALRNKEIDALFYVVGTPAKVLEEQILPEDNFHLIPTGIELTAEDDFYSKLYSPSTIPENSYAWQTENISTLAVQSFLITTVNQDCQHVTPVAELIRDNLSWLQENGDPVWKNVDLKVVHDQQVQRASQCFQF